MKLQHIKKVLKNWSQHLQGSVWNSCSPTWPAIDSFFSHAACLKKSSFKSSFCSYLFRFGKALCSWTILTEKVFSHADCYMLYSVWEGMEKELFSTCQTNVCFTKLWCDWEKMWIVKIQKLQTIWSVCFMFQLQDGDIHLTWMYLRWSNKTKEATFLLVSLKNRCLLTKSFVQPF